MPESTPASLLLTAAALAVALALVLMPLARKLGWMDRPGSRKVHENPTPLVGGLAVFGAFAGVLAGFGLAGTGWLLAGSAIVLLSGLVDDRWPQSAARRFLAQILACGVMVLGAGVQLNDFGELLWPATLGLGIFAIPVTIFAALGVINAVNMIDGLDGQCGSVFVVACTALAFLAARAGHMDDVAVIAAATGAVLGFLALNGRLPWNRRARIFLGDSGSVLLGFLLAWFCIDLGNGADRALAPMTAVWILGIPLLDTTRLIRRRWREGVSAFEADQYHLHHVFLRSGFGTGQTWWAVTGLSALSASIGVAFEVSATPEYWRFYAFIAFGLVYLAVLRQAWRSGRFLGREIAPAA